MQTKAAQIARVRLTRNDLISVQDQSFLVNLAPRMVQPAIVEQHGIGQLIGCEQDCQSEQRSGNAYSVHVASVAKDSRYG